MATFKVTEGICNDGNTPCTQCTVSLSVDDADSEWEAPVKWFVNWGDSDAWTEVSDVSASVTHTYPWEQMPTSRSKSKTNTVVS